MSGLTPALSTPSLTAGPARVVAQPIRLAWPGRLTRALVVTDMLAIAVSLMVAQLVRFGAPPAGRPAMESLYLWVAVAIAVLWLVTLSATRSRDTRVIGVGVLEYQRVLNATLWTFGLLAILAFIAQLDVARGYLAVALPVGLVLLLGGRVVWRRTLVALRRSGRCLTGAIVVGPAADVRRVVAQLQVNLRAGYRPIAVVVTDGRRLKEWVDSIPEIPIDELPAISRRTRTRAVMIAGNLPGGREQIREIGWQLENARTELILVSRLTDVAGPRMHLRPVQDLPMVHVDLPQYTGVNHAIKRVMDVVAAGAALVLLAPLLAFLAMSIRLSSDGPVIFRQTRVGLKGTTFTMFKFRSMVVDAEARLAELQAERDAGNAVLFKIKDDPRITPIGRIMRRYSLDELPQFMNVLLGDMSLIGPRPPLPAEVEMYEDRVNRRLLIKPGITGLWQVSGRSNLSWEDSVKLDLSYVENWSVTGDLVILLKTARAVFRKEGAY
ncbi:sugar transferase [Protaetiibacter intestinalis]|uniref:Sugar transferase n=1 Tax=Protaetiibacter intestinalis TaxID=2419774 RepID=A0A387BB34_9MICO|nr:sugar transferase [Protaetiibacter intestinalis]AYF98918.1 sugar transferase [Protaetiibacter intestinalis]